MIPNSSKGAAETKLYKEFCDYTRGFNPTGNSTQSSALYNIYPETEGLRQIRDVRDELKMIQKIWDKQNEVVKDFGWDSTFLAKRDTVLRLDQEAAAVEQRVMNPPIQDTSL
jgi:hypothetical protein